MSQQEQPQQQPTVRHIPIFVEGRSEPLVNKIPESQPSRDSSTSSMPGDHQGPTPQQHQQQQPRMPEMPSHHSTSDFFKHGSIFDRARDFPVRTFPSATANFFTNSNPGRESSPARQVPIFTTDASSATTTVPPAARGSSQPRQTPSPPTAAQQQQQYQQQQAQRFQQQKQQASAQDQPDAAAATAQPAQAPPPPANDPISKIQKIQRDVLAIFDQVERFQGGKDGKRDKQYLYLDEMLTQNLLKLDSIDAEDQPQIKSARREAIKSINHCIAVLEAKAEAAGGSEAEAATAVSGSASSDKVPNGTADRTGSGASLSHSSSNSSSQQQPQQQQ